MSGKPYLHSDNVVRIWNKRNGIPIDAKIREAELFRFLEEFMKSEANTSGHRFGKASLNNYMLGNSPISASSAALIRAALDCGDVEITYIRRDDLRATSLETDARDISGAEAPSISSDGIDGNVIANSPNSQHVKRANGLDEQPPASLLTGETFVLADRVELDLNGSGAFYKPFAVFVASGFFAALFVLWPLGNLNDIFNPFMDSEGRAVGVGGKVMLVNYSSAYFASGTVAAVLAILLLKRVPPAPFQTFTLSMVLVSVLWAIFVFLQDALKEGWEFSGSSKSFFEEIITVGFMGAIAQLVFVVLLKVKFEVKLKVMHVAIAMLSLCVILVLIDTGVLSKLQNL